LTLEDTSAGMMAAPVAVDNGHKVVSAHSRPKGLLPSTWLGRELKIEYLAGDAVRTTSGVLAELYPAGPILLISGARTLVSWDRIVLVELVGD
jgi:hypothetical protein